MSTNSPFWWLGSASSQATASESGGHQCLAFDRHAQRGNCPSPFAFFIPVTPFAEAVTPLAHGWGSVYNLPVAGIWLTGPCDVGISH